MRSLRFSVFVSEATLCRDMGCPHWTHLFQASSREETTGGSSKSESDSATAASAASESAGSHRSVRDHWETVLIVHPVSRLGEPSQVVLDNMVFPGLSTFSSDEAAMAVIMSLLEADVNMGQSVDFEDLHWPF